MDASTSSGRTDLCDRLSTAALLLARRFADGATMWCLAPTAPEHARHVAVEFVHPVIMGKRALPAVSVAGPDHIAHARSLVESGDVLVAVSALDDAVVREALQRSPAWGLTTVWVAWDQAADGVDGEHLDAGARGGSRTAGCADVVLVADGGPDARFDGRLVRLYHVIWELTHVCFEHPGLLRADEGCDDDVCVTCSDEGRLGEVLACDGGPDATVRTARGIERVDVSLVGDVVPDDLLLVHAGSALTLVGVSGR